MVVLPKFFQPQSVTNAAGNILDPRTGKQYEVGLKAEVFENANATLAYFNLTDKNRAVSDPNNLSYYLANGEAKLQGLELEVSGTIRIAGRQLPHTRSLTRSSRTQTALRALNSTHPSTWFSCGRKYTFDDRTPALDGFFIGGGVKMFSSFKNVSRTAAGGATSIEAPGYAVFDLQAGYKFNEHVTASLTVNNVFDKTYYERVGGTSVFNFYGEPRTVVLRVGTTFLNRVELGGMPVELNRADCEFRPFSVVQRSHSDRDRQGSECGHHQVSAGERNGSPEHIERPFRARLRVLLRSRHLQRWLRDRVRHRAKALSG